MICPNLRLTLKPVFQCECTVSLDASLIRTETVNQYCATDQYDLCPYFYKKKGGIRHEIHSEVIRAIG